MFTGRRPYRCRRCAPCNYSNESGNPPSGAYDVSCHDESHEVCEERVVDQGNGYGEVVQDCHDESQQYCSYTVDEWETIQTYYAGRFMISIRCISQPNMALGPAPRR